MIIQPIWARDSVPTRRGWMRGNELLKAQQITQDQLDEYNAFHHPEESAPEVVEEIVEAVEEETPTEEVEETPAEDETPTEQAEEPVEEAEETPTEETEVSTPTLLTEAPISGKNLEDMNEADLANVIPPNETKKNKNPLKWLGKKGK